MLRTLSVLFMAILTGGCGIMPGMENLNTIAMRKHVAPVRVTMNPTLIPITPSLIADQRVSTYYYRVAPADVLNISVWQHPEFQMEVQMPGVSSTQGATTVQNGYLVNSTGAIFFPLIGYVHVAGKTVDRIRSDVTQRLKKYVPDPQVSVRVSEFRGQKIYVLGEVKQPGFLSINDQPMTIADALAFSGWLDMTSADPRNIYVIRGDYTKPLIFWLDARTPDRLLLGERFSLQPRDVLYVSSAPITSMNRALNQLLPIIQAIWFTQSIVRNS